MPSGRRVPPAGWQIRALICIDGIYDIGQAYTARLGLGAALIAPQTGTGRTSANHANVGRARPGTASRAPLPWVCQPNGVT